MLINASLPSPARAPRAAFPKAESSPAFQNEPVDGWNPGDSKAVAAFAPYGLALLAGAAGLASGFGDGAVAVAGAAVAGAAGGAAVGTVFSSITQFSERGSELHRGALLGAGGGALAGAVLSVTAGAHPLLGVALAAGGTAGGWMMGNVLKTVA